MNPKDSATGRKASARQLVCLLGLPIDVMTLSDAMARVRHAVSVRERLFISTPNLNFLVASQHDEAFRESVLRSDLSLADGSSIVMLGRIVGAHLPERVTGSDLFEQLAISQDQPPIKVFFFGGPDGVAPRAAQRLNQDFPGMTCVGYHEPGFGDVPSMSKPDVIDKINASGADFVVVALGAKKGQQWIMHNRDKLHAPVISHLGAVVNFVAGTVRRAPVWMRNTGLEWIWRIREEPALWQRYWDDGRDFLHLLLSRGIAVALAERRQQHVDDHQASLVVEASGNSHCLGLALHGTWTAADLPTLRRAIDASSATQIILDLSKTQWLDLHCLGYIEALHGELLNLHGRGVSMRRMSAALRRHLLAANGGYMLDTQESELTEIEA